jgi:predicted ferric reductase
MAGAVDRVGISHRLGAWALLYLVVSLTPLFVILLGDEPPERGFWIEFGVALGFVGLAMMSLQAVLTARFSTVSMALGQDTLLQFHRQAGIVAFLLVMAHPVILLAADSSNWDFLDPRTNILRAPALWVVIVAFPVLIVTSLWRQQLRISYEWWRLGHGVLAVLVVLIGLVHITRVDYYLANPWKRALWLALGTASILSVAYVRLVKPWRLRRHPHRIAAVEPLARGTWRVRVEPVSGSTMHFQPGQFAFLTIADSPFSLDQHPFSLASSADDHHHLEFAIKELGDFTSTIGDVSTGATAFVDGPYGGLTLDTRRSAGLFAVCGGIGISPVIAMVRTLAARAERVPAVVVYANNRREEAAYADELDSLAAEMGDDLQVVHVLADPPEGWTGEQGLVTPELLGRLLPDSGSAQWQYVVCGPPPMMEAVEQALLDLDIPLGRIDSERFDIGAAAATGRRHTNVRRLVVALGP